MHIDPRVFLSRPEDLRPNGAGRSDTLKPENLSKALKEAADGSDRIFILSAYYGTDYLKSFLGAIPRRSRTACAITLVFGVENAARLPQAVEDLRKLRRELVTLGFPSPSVRLFTKRAPFHTKLYHFKRGTQPVWFIGSANASPAIDGARHELMVRLRGRHEQLMEYSERVIEQSVIVAAAPPDALVTDLQSFFLRGSLCYRPLTRLGFTFEACQITGEHRAVLRESLAAASEVPHADPQTEGFGFSLADAVGQISGKRFQDLAREEAAGRSTGRIKFRHMAVETIYGYWLPAAYAENVEEKLKAIEEKSLKRLKAFAADLDKISHESLEKELASHVEGLKAFFAGHSVAIEPKKDYRKSFKSFIEARRDLLSDDDRLKRMTRRLHVEQMPDIWGDPDSAEKFEASFFEDLSLRFDSSNFWIADVLRAELKLNGDMRAEALRAALEQRLEAGISDGFWWAESADPELDDE
jgi:hypothetical protein